MADEKAYRVKHSFNHAKSETFFTRANESEIPEKLSKAEIARHVERGVLAEVSPKKGRVVRTALDTPVPASGSKPAPKSGAGSKK